ncbi:hypothetical protein VP01_1668g2 [Puccinia sorghi]|uniref:Uncharacterized protein n=1 Tax=Puccinia sorghi TaxID=27349 RepID=A0A0L6VG80_9BASI|nr:hypothetical protein VP01_1668g2 [Puccinia sorghi]
MREHVASPTSNQRGNLTGNNQAVLESLVGVLGILVENQALIYQICNVNVSLTPQLAITSGVLAGSIRSHVYGATVRVSNFSFLSQYVSISLFNQPPYRPAAVYKSGQSSSTPSWKLILVFRTKVDGEAISSVVSFLCNMVKYEQNTLRNLVSDEAKKNYKCYSQALVGAVPKLSGLFFVIDRGFRAQDFPQTVAEVERDITTASKIQLAFLRMITMIDNLLVQLRSFSSHQKQAWAFSLSVWHTLSAANHTCQTPKLGNPRLHDTLASNS